MVPVKTYSMLWEYVRSLVPQLKRSILVSEESELQTAIKEIDLGEIFLVAIIPSSETESWDGDNFYEVDSCYVFILKKNDIASMTPQEILNDRDLTQKITTQVKTSLKTMAQDTSHNFEFSHLLHRIIFNKMHTDPEYNYLGCNGWSISFALKTPGFE